MKHLSASFSKLLTVAACALTLGSCQRAEYAFLPKTSSYHGVARVAAPVPVEREDAAPAAPASAPAVAPTPPAAPAAAATAPAASSTAARPAPLAEVAPASVAAPATVVAPTPPRKLNLVQRLAVAKVGKQLRKAADLTQFKQKSAAAETQRISGNLRTGLILLLVGLLVGLFNGLIGTIIALIGVIFIVLWLLDSL